MGLFAGTNPFDADVEKVTDAKNTSEDWGLIIDLCDRVQAVTTGPKDCLRSIIKRLNHQDPHVVIQAITLLDACANNCGKPFRLEVASREFETEFRKLLAKSHPRIKEKLKGMLKKWAEGEFKNDSALSLIPSLYSSLKKEGIDFSSSSDPAQKKRPGQAAAALPKDPNVVSSQQEEDDIARAIQLSLQETSKSSPARHATSTVAAAASAGSLYPSANALGNGNGYSALQNVPTPKKDEKKGRALYDFEAAEDNELTFKAGEIVIITDDSDVNWWRGSNHRGEGLFPANFVTLDLNSAAEGGGEDKQRRRSVQFNEEVEVKTMLSTPLDGSSVQPAKEVEISEEQIDYVLNLLHEADPTSSEHDSPDLPSAEEGVLQMGPLIDSELECVDRRHAQLTRLSTELVDALNLYHQLMHEMPAYSMPPATSGMPNHSAQMYSMPPGPYMHPASMPGMPPMAGMPPQSMPYMPQQPAAYLPNYNGYMPNDAAAMYANAPPPPTPPLQSDGVHMPQQIPGNVGYPAPSGHPAMS